MTTNAKVPNLADLFADTADPEHASLIAEDLATLTPKELSESFREATRVTQGLMVMGEGLSMATYMVLADAYRRAEEG